MELKQCLAQEWKPVSSTETESENSNGCIDCNICFEHARDPVVTLCGHLYCWPCIYKWFHFQSTTLKSDKQPQCPVCKAEVSHATLVPLYGRGQSPTDPNLQGDTPCHDMIVIPPRPRALIHKSHPGQQVPYQNHYQNQHFNEEGNSSVLPVMGMFGEIVYARMFGNSESLYTYPNSYHIVGSSNPRMRRVDMQADKSLTRILFFLLCCLVLCLLQF